MGTGCRTHGRRDRCFNTTSEGRKEHGRWDLHGLLQGNGEKRHREIGVQEPPERDMEGRGRGSESDHRARAGATEAAGLEQLVSMGEGRNRNGAGLADQLCAREPETEGQQELREVRELLRGEHRAGGTGEGSGGRKERGPGPRPRTRISDHSRRYSPPAGVPDGSGEGHGGQRGHCPGASYYTKAKAGRTTSTITEASCW